MRHNNNRRMKNRNHGGQRHGGGKSNVPPRMQVFDSNGPDVRIRGTAWQVHEKYLALAKDAAAIGDVVMAESYSQHAEHYQRIINTFAEQMGQQWTPPAQNDDVNQQGAEIVAEQPQQQTQAAPRADRRDDLGLPTSLFKPAAQQPALETA